MNQSSYRRKALPCLNAPNRSIALACRVSAATLLKCIWLDGALPHAVTIVLAE